MTSADPDARLAPPPPGDRPPAPPATGEPGDRPDPADPGPPIVVRIEGIPLGDLGNPTVDSRLLTAVLMRNGEVAGLLRRRRIDIAEVLDAFPQGGWPLRSPSGGSAQPGHPRDRSVRLDVDLQAMPVGPIGDRAADARLLWAIARRPGRMSEWLAAHGLDADAIDAVFPGARW